MSSPKNHIARLKKLTRRVEDEIHRMHDDGHIKDAEEYIRISDLSDNVHSVRQAIESYEQADVNQQFMEKS